MLLFLDSYVILVNVEYLLLFESGYCLCILKLIKIVTQAVCRGHLKVLPWVLQGAWARWALLSSACISATSRQIHCPGIQCFWKLAVSQALVANSVKFALDNNNSNALLCKCLSRGFGDCVDYSSCKPKVRVHKKCCCVLGASRHAKDWINVSIFWNQEVNLKQW